MKLKCIISICLFFISMSSFANYKIIANPSVTKLKGVWEYIDTIYGNWNEFGSVYNCSAWSPDTNTVLSGNSFTQEQSCSQKEQRTVMEKQKFTSTGEIRDVNKENEERVVLKTNTRTAVGTKVSLIGSVGSCEFLWRINYDERTLNISYNSTIVAKYSGSSYSFLRDKITHSKTIDGVRYEFERSERASSWNTGGGRYHIYHPAENVRKSVYAVSHQTCIKSVN